MALLFWFLSLAAIALAIYFAVLLLQGKYIRAKGTKIALLILVSIVLIDLGLFALKPIVSLSVGDAVLMTRKDFPILFWALGSLLAIGIAIYFFAALDQGKYIRAKGTRIFTSTALLIGLAWLVFGSLLSLMG